MFGLALAALVAGEAVLEASDWTKAARIARGCGPLWGASLAAALATPFGIEGLLLPFRLVHMDFAMSVTREWQSPNFQLPQPLEPWLMLLLLGALTFGLRLPVTRIAMLLLLLHMALQQSAPRRASGPDGAFVAGAFAGRTVGEESLGGGRSAPGGSGGARPDRRDGTDRPPHAGAQRHHDRRRHRAEGWASRAGRGARVCPSQGLIGPVFNDINFGDYLIYVGIAPFIDGRIDMYGDEFVRRYADVEEFPALAAQYGFTWAVLSPGNPHVPLLDHLTGWRRARTDKVAVVYVRE